MIYVILTAWACHEPADHQHWGLLLLVPLLHGPGKISLDYLLSKALAALHKASVAHIEVAVKIAASEIFTDCCDAINPLKALQIVKHRWHRVCSFRLAEI